MLTRLLVVRATPGPDVKFEGETRPILGYYQQLGITARDEIQLQELAARHVYDDLGGELEEIADVWEPDWEGEDAEVREDLTGDPQEVGVWYFGGHALFVEDDGEGEDEEEK